MVAGVVRVRFSYRMSRMGKAYESRFRALLLRLHARRLEPGVDWLLARSKQRSLEGVSVVQALSDRYEHLRKQVKDFEARKLTHGKSRREFRVRFLCDAGLGGLARWLRAAGYEAIWFPDIDDAELLRRAQSLDAILLTTDSLMMERGVLRDGVIPAFWLPPVWLSEEKLALVLREFDLPVREPRCMSCGGELQTVNKESMRDRIPPKTWKWINDYFQCARCGQLFWRGTHWQKIQTALGRLVREKAVG